MWLTISIVLGCLLAMTIWLLNIAVHLRNRLSTPPSPTPSTTPTPASDELLLKMMKEMNSGWAKEMEQTRQMVADLTLGRESPNPTTDQEMSQTWRERPQGFDYDSTPLSPGIEAVLEREEEETEQARILREREELQARRMELQAEIDRLKLEDESGPQLNGDNPRHARTD